MQVRPAGLAKAWPWRSVTPWRYVLGSRESQSLAQDDCEGTASAMWHDGAPRRIARPKPRRSRGAHAHLHFPQLGTVALEKHARKRLRALSTHRGLSSHKPPPLVPRALLAGNPFDARASLASEAHRHTCRQGFRPPLRTADSKSCLDARNSGSVVCRDWPVREAVHTGVHLSADGVHPIRAATCRVCLRGHGRVLAEPGRAIVPLAPAVDQPGCFGGFLIEVRGSPLGSVRHGRRSHTRLRDSGRPRRRPSRFF